MASYKDYFKYFNNDPTAYAAEIKRKKAAGIAFDDPEAAASFEKDNAYLFKDSTPTMAKTARPTYQSPYADQIGDTLSAISNRGRFRYDPEDDRGLQAAQENATDAVSRAAARRNMLYSSSNKSQMGKAALALVPQFEQNAFSRYQQEGSNLYNQLSALSGLENTAYSQYSGNQNLAMQLQQIQQAKELADRNYNLQSKGLEYNPEYQLARIAEAQRAAKAPYSTGGSYSPSQRVDDLIKIWGITGNAPAGLEGLGVNPGATYPGSKGAGQGDEAKYQEGMTTYINAINNKEKTLKQAYEEIDQYMASRVISQNLGEIMKATLKNIYEQQKPQGNSGAYDFDYSAGFAP